MTDDPAKEASAVPDIAHRHLRRALEFAVAVAELTPKRPGTPEIVAELRPFASKPKLSTRDLGRVRRLVEDAPDFRTALAANADADQFGEIGLLWLTRPTGWEQRIDDLAARADAAGDRGDQAAAIRRAEKQRLGAERNAARARADLIEMTADRDRTRGVVEELRTDVVKLEEELSELRSELTDARNEIRHARDREAAAKARLDTALRDRDRAARSEQLATNVRDEVLAARTETAASVAEVEAAAEAARALVSRLESLLPETDLPDDRPPVRAPLALPGGILSNSAEAAEYLCRSDAAVLVDGYNVTKLAWPARSLATQREMLLDAAENLARRHGADITVVFDGASVTGAHATRRRLVRVVYSPEGVIADDVLRDEVRRLPTSRPVVVVTNDKEIIRDVRADGANTVPSNAFLAIL